MPKKTENKVSYRQALKFWWRFIGPVYKPVWWIVVFLLVSIAVSLIEPNVYRLVIDALTNGMEKGSIDFQYVFSLLALWGVISVINLIVFSLYRLIFAYRLPRIDLAYYAEAFKAFFNLDVSKHLSKKSGEQLKKIDRAGDGLWSVTIPLAEDVFPNWLTAFAMLVLAFWINWPMALVTVSMVPFYVWIFGYGHKNTSDLQDKMMKEYDKFWGDAHDLAANILSVKSYAKEKYHLGNIIAQMGSISKKQSKISLRWGAISAAGHIISIFTRLVIFVGGIYFMSVGVATLGTVIMFLSMSGAIYAPLYGLGGQLRNFQRQAGHLNEAEKIFNEINHVQDNPGARNFKIREGRIEIKNISFSYDKVEVIKNVSFEAEPGTMVALVGHSGGGKSTLASLLSRFYDVAKGEILIDGHNVKEVTQKSLRENIGLVMQDNTMFNDTIFNNIRYARPNASKQEVIEAAKLANIHKFIMSQPEKYETLVGERGLKLSGGQKQRVAIARVILKNPPILILDEATSALDSASEKVVQEALERVMKGRTSIVIAHRLSTVRKADKIIVLNKGRLIQQGRHADLSKQPGVYKELVDLQVGGLLAE